MPATEYSIASTQSALPTNPAIGTCGGCTVGTTTTAESYTPAATALAGGTAYYWEVQALAASGSSLNGPWSSVSNFITPAGDFSLSASPSSLTIAPGGSGTSTVTLTAINNFSGTVTPTCAVSSSLAGVTCAVSDFGTNNSRHRHHNCFHYRNDLSARCPAALASAHGGWPPLPCLASC